MRERAPFIDNINKWLGKAKLLKINYRKIFKFSEQDFALSAVWAWDQMA